MAHISEIILGVLISFFSSFGLGFHSVAQAGLRILGSSSLPVSAFCMTKTVACVLVPGSISLDSLISLFLEAAGLSHHFTETGDLANMLE